MRDVSEGVCSPALLQAVCAAGAVFIARSEESESRRATWVKEAEDLVLSKIDGMLFL